VSFWLDYAPPPVPPEPTAADPDDALYDLAEAGATATVALDGYRLPVRWTGLVELARGCRALLAVIATGTGHPGDEDLRRRLPDVPDGAVLHSWLFASYQYELPLLVFAVEAAMTTVYTRTRSETPAGTPIVLEGRDLRDPVRVATAAVAAQARGFLDALP
jgi:hypothetical protein